MRTDVCAMPTFRTISDAEKTDIETGWPARKSARECRLSKKGGVSAKVVRGPSVDVLCPGCVVPSDDKNTIPDPPEIAFASQETVWPVGRWVKTTPPLGVAASMRRVCSSPEV